MHGAPCAKKDLKLTFGVEGALLKHAVGQVHRKRVTEAESANKSLSALYFTKFNAPSQSNTATLAASNVAPTTDVVVLVDFVQEHVKIQSCEIRWALKVVNNHCSFRSCLGLNNLF